MAEERISAWDAVMDGVRSEVGFCCSDSTGETATFREVNEVEAWAKGRTGVAVRVIDLPRAVH